MQRFHHCLLLQCLLVDCACMRACVRVCVCMHASASSMSHMPKLRTTLYLPTSQERPRIYFQRTVTGRLERCRKDSDRAKYLRQNPVDPTKMDLVVPSAEIYTKVLVGFSGLLFMVRLGAQDSEDCCHYTTLLPVHLDVNL